MVDFATQNWAQLLRAARAGESIEGKSTDQAQLVRFQDLDVTEVFTESELI